MNTTTTKNAVQAGTFADDLDMMTPPELRELQDDLIAARDEANASLDKLRSHVADRFKDRLARAWDAAPNPYGTVWADGGGDCLVRSESDRRDTWNQDALRDAVRAHPELLDLVRIEVMASVLNQMPAPLKSEVEAALTVSGSRPRVRLFPKY